MTADAHAATSPRRTPFWTAGSGADVAWLFHRLLALVFLVAWLSLGVQLRLLIGARGLLPLVDFVEAARAEGVLSFFAFPSLLTLHPSDGVLLAGIVCGIALALAALLGLGARVCTALQVVLYLAYVTACRAFLTFQWDSLLLEAAFLASFLPTRRPAPLVHFLFRALLFKLYFESGLAKWQSPLGDWRDGSAMTFYYETAPLPTRLAWYAHHLPAGWHHLESRATLLLELVVPFAIFGPRRARLTAAALLTLFQLINAATANYGFFCYLSVCLHVFLLDDADVAAWRARFEKRRPERALFSRWRARLRWPPAPRRGLALVAVAGWLGVSLVEALFHFGNPGPLAEPLAPVLELSQTYRLVNPYHLFGAVTRDRIEPEFQVQTTERGDWAALAFKYKPGPVDRAPPFVAPHQPRVDFLLWFYGLSFARRQPGYVSGLLAKLCEEPGAVAALFTAPPPGNVRAVRIVFWDYRFTSSDERRATGAWWTRHPVQTSTPVRCSP
ncbi:MAG TPA: lipase maturation factor family protein [Polyangia bacterium]|jgi:hypothetical protein